MTKKRRDSLSSKDRELWQEVAKTVKPLNKKDLFQPEAPKLVQRAPSEKALPADWFIGKSLTPDPRIDRKSKRRIASGRTSVNKSIDLHGLSQSQAYDLLSRTIERSVRDGHKVLIVVTGKGGRRYSQTDSISAAFRTRADFEQFGGVLRRMVPLWLEGPELKPFIQSYGTASKEHGGEGALYVLLRRNKFERG
ncbi:DNA mismatch repair protein MutS [Kordiimonas sediminis]|uniref:DNA mismatch repair protein MutS n=1 Tax=Kordiimonas sediminis TaxID=1735581 RepID=A0A919AMP2_9PROT|nr:Smr/MutS family protein [Kordiimonas sediminis]GHF15253.1 DNA mismatch repair protein MutS [Kordiimonas sediminis]